MGSNVRWIVLRRCESSGKINLRGYVPRCQDWYCSAIARPIVRRTATTVVADPKRTPSSPPTRRFNFRSFAMPVKRTVQSSGRLYRVVRRRNWHTSVRRSAFCCPRYCDQPRVYTFRQSLFYHFWSSHRRRTLLA